jgi:hypothetical protein
MLSLPPTCCWGDKIEESEINRACGMGSREMHTGLWQGRLKEKDHLDNIGVHRKIILKWIISK